MDDKRVFCRDYPPLALESQEPALHFCERDTLSRLDFANMLIQPGTQVSLAFRQFLCRLADVNQLIFPVDA